MARQVSDGAHDLPESVATAAVEASHDNGKGLLSAAQIIQSSDIPREVVSCPEWGGNVLIKGMTGRERDAFEAESIKSRKPGDPVEVSFENIRSRLLVRCIVDENDVPLFPENNMQMLSKKSAIPLDRCFAVAQRLSGLTKEDVEELVGNSDAPHSDEPLTE